MKYKNIRGLVGGIQKFSTEDGPGIRTTVFLKGCPLSCRWCHNPELIDPEIQLMRCPSNCIGCGACAQVCPHHAISFPGGEFHIDWNACSRCMKCAEVCWSRALNAAGQWMTVEDVMAQVLQDKDFYRHTGGGMTVSGGELLNQPDFAEALLDACSEAGIGAALDTSGYGSLKILLRLASHKNCGHILFDLKHIESDAHKRYTGAGSELILQNLEALASDPGINPKLIIRMPLISGVNDAEKTIRETGAFLAANSLKAVTLLPYHNLGVSKCRNIGGEPELFEAPGAGRIEEIREYFESCGIKVEILGK